MAFDVTILEQAGPPVLATVRGHKVVVGMDVARLFGIEHKRLNEQVLRNGDRFDADFAFRLTSAEFNGLRSHFATSNEDGARGGNRYLPFAFTEHGVVMAATVLKTERAIAASKHIVRVFVAARHAATEGHPGQVPDWVRARWQERLGETLGKVLDAIVDPVSGSSVRQEAQAIATEGLAALKAHLQARGIENQQGLAEVRKLLGEADLISAQIAARHIETEHRRLALVAKQLRITLETQRYLDSGRPDGLMGVLQDIAAA